MTSLLGIEDGETFQVKPKCGELIILVPLEMYIFSMHIAAANVTSMVTFSLPGTTSGAGRSLICNSVHAEGILSSFSRILAILLSRKHAVKATL